MRVCLRYDLRTEAGQIPVVRQQVESLLQRLGVCNEDVDRVDVILTEACANVVRHAYDEPGRPYQLEVRCSDEQLVVVVRDEGKGFDAALIPTPIPGQIGGYGVYFIRKLADRVTIDSPGGLGTRVVAELDLQSGFEETLTARTMGFGVLK